MRCRAMGSMLAMAAALAGAMPASAQRYAGPGPGERAEHRGGGGGLGALLVGALIGGVVVAAASSHHNPPPPPPPPPGDVPPPPPPPARPFYATADDRRSDAIDACVAAIEAEGLRQAPFARVTQVTTVAQVGERFSINGRVVLRADGRDPGERHVFRCRLVPGTVQRASIDEPI